MAFTITERYAFDARLHACSVCGADQRIDRKGNREVILDTGVDISFEGRFQICEKCIEEGAKLLGFVSPKKFEKVEAERDEARQEAKEAHAALDAKTEALRVLTSELAAAQHAA